jgi:hypothetical protein
MLRKDIEQSDVVIHIAGSHYGANAGNAQFPPFADSPSFLCAESSLVRVGSCSIARKAPMLLAGRPAGSDAPRFALLETCWSTALRAA